MNIFKCLDGAENCAGICNTDVGNSSEGVDSSRTADCELGSLDSESAESYDSRTLSPWEIMAFFIFMTALGFAFAMLTMKWLQDKGFI